MIKEISFTNIHAEQLMGYVHIPKNYDTAIIFCHGFPTDCEGGTATTMAMLMEELGYLVVRFSFSGSGKSEGKFEEKTMSKEVGEIGDAINFLEDNYQYKNLALIGHSTGGIDSLLYAHTDNRIDALVTIGATGNLQHGVNYDFHPGQVKDFWEKGHIVYDRPDKEWLHGKKLYKTFYDEFFSLDPLRAIQDFYKPVLVMHSGSDEMLPSTKDPLEILEAANEPKQLCILKGADHRMSHVKHKKKAAKEIHRFFKKYLSSKKLS